MISKLNSSQKKVMVCHMSGAFQTPEGLKHWKEGFDIEICPFCQSSPNSKKHLFLECEKTAEARNKHPNLISEDFEWVETFFALPVCTSFPEENILNRIRFTRPMPKAWFSYKDDQLRTFFTDGSATVADLEIDREAAWAIVEDLCQ